MAGSQFIFLKHSKTLVIRALFFYIWRVKWRWYFTGLIIALAFFGAGIEQSTLPNQEIVVQFNTNSVSEVEAKRAVSNITSQLKSIGVDDFKISEIRNGALKVTYYSTKDIAIIKNLFVDPIDFQLEGSSLGNNSTEFPSKEDSDTYEVNVVIIQKDSRIDLGLQGLPVEIKSATDQYLNPIVSLGVPEANFNFKKCFENIAFKNYRNISLLIDTTSHKIPEVRAGPLS